MEFLTLNNGVDLPALGLGVFQTPPEETRVAVETALADGYQHVDTAAAYGNERQVGGNTASEDRRYVVTYDALHRPLSRTLALNGGAPLTLERLEYSNARN